MRSYIFAAAGICCTLAGAQHYSLHYNGRQESIIPDCAALDQTRELTVSLWIKPDGNDPDQFFRYLLSKNYGDAGWGLLLSRDYRLRGTGTGQTERKVPVGRWNHVAYVKSDKLIKLYIDGRLADTQKVSGDFHTSDLQLTVGCSSFFGEPGHQFTNFSGNLDEIQIWDKALTQAQVKSRMHRRLTGLERHLVVYLPFTEGKGQMSANRTGKTPPLRLGRTFRPDDWDPTWSRDVPFRSRGR